MLRRAYQPILIAARFPWRRYAAGDLFRAELWLVNDGPAAWQGCCADAFLDGAMVWTATDITLPPASVSRIGELAVPLDAAPQTLALNLRCGGMLLAPNRYDLAIHLPGRQPRRARAIHAVGECLLGVYFIFGASKHPERSSASVRAAQSKDATLRPLRTLRLRAAALRSGCSAPVLPPT